MGYLYLNFIDNLENGSRNPNDLYNSSLNEQYESLRRRFGRYYSGTFQEFISLYCPMTANEYYISLPSFDRGIRTVVNKNGKENQYINNIIIRPKKSPYSRNVIPDNYDLILIGDVMLGSVISVSIKGIDIIDSSIAKFGEMRVVCTAACAFARTVLRIGASVPDYGIRELHEPVLTNDFVNRLCNEVYPVPNPSKALKTFDDWGKYIKFRKYYLNKQSERCERIDTVAVCDSYMISKETYRRNEEDYKPFLFDDVADFAKGEQVILSKQVIGADSFPLIRVEINKNRKEILSETTGRFGKGKPKFEAHIRRYTREAMGLSATEPRYDDNGNLQKGYRFQQYILGERYLLTHIDIAPDCSEIEQKYEKEYKAAVQAIDAKYDSIISVELSRFIAEQTAVIESEYARQFEDYKRGLSATLDDEVRTNNDKEVKRAFEKAIEEAIAPIKMEYDKKRKEIETAIAKLKNDKDGKEKEKLQTELSALKRQYEEDCAYAARRLDIRDFYIARNKKLIENKRKSLEIAEQAEIDKRKKDKKFQLDAQYKGQIRSEEETKKKELTQKCEEEKAVKIENETVRRYLVYFRPDDNNKTINQLEKETGGIEARFLTYDNRAEKAKIERQEKALESFKGGYVKNPYLASYLFAPESFGTAPRAVGPL